MKTIWKRYRYEEREYERGTYKEPHFLGFLVVTSLREEIVNHRALYVLKGHRLGDESKTDTYHLKHYNVRSERKQMFDITDEEYKTLVTLSKVNRTASLLFNAYLEKLEKENK